MQARGSIAGGKGFCALLLGLAVGVMRSVNPAEAAPAIVEVQTAAPAVIAVVVQTDTTYEVEDRVTTLDPLNLNRADWKVDGESPAGIHRYSLPWDELPYVPWKDPSHPRSWPVTTRHRIYLHLNQPLREGHRYELTTPYGTAGLTFDSRTTFCEAIKVNQVGYSRLSTSRFANFGVYLGDGGSMKVDPLPEYEVVDERGGQVVASGTAVYMRDDTAAGAPHSGEHVYRLSLNQVPDGGPYFVSVKGCGRSRSFGIGDRYAREIAYVATRGMYHHRCGLALERPFTAFTHAVCHTNIAYGTRSASPQDEVLVTPGSPMGFVQGGYHDAGDMDHPENHPPISILMLACYEAFPAHFTDGQYNLPESGNGIPDFLDEILWGVRLWEHLQVADPRDAEYGGVMSGWSTVGYTSYGGQSAASDGLLYGTKNVQDELTALCAGIFAQTSRLVRRHDAAHADALLNRARLAWAYLRARNFHQGPPRTCLMYASLQLYLATGEDPFHQYFQAAANGIVVGNGSWPEQYLPGNSAAKCQTAHFISYLLPGSGGIDPALAEQLKAKILFFADRETYMGPPPETEPYPQGVTKFLGFGAGTAQGRYADVWVYGSLFARDAAARQRYINAVCQYADYALGLNPMGMSYYTGLGTDQPNSPLDCNSYYTKYGLSDGVTADIHRDATGRPIGNVPGILVYGPVEGSDGRRYQTALFNKSYPAFDQLPWQRRYCQGWSLVICNEFTVHETMVWNVVMHGFLYDASMDASALAFRILSATLEGNEIVLRWEASAGQRFQVETSTTLKADEWSGVGEVLEASAATVSWRQAIGAGRIWFRVRRETTNGHE